jgi:hypothetical protein
VRDAGAALCTPDEDQSAARSSAAQAVAVLPARTGSQDEECSEPRVPRVPRVPAAHWRLRSEALPEEAEEPPPRVEREADSPDVLAAPTQREQPEAPAVVAEAQASPAAAARWSAAAAQVSAPQPVPAAEEALRASGPEAQSSAWARQGAEPAWAAEARLQLPSSA